MKSYNRKIISNTFILYIRMAIVLGISIYTARVILEALGVENFGIYNVVAGFIAFFAILNNSLGTTVQRFITLEIANPSYGGIKPIFSMSVTIHIGLCLVVLAFGEIAFFTLFPSINIPGERFNSARFVYQFSLLTFAIAVLNVPFASYLRAKEHFTYIAYVQIIEALLRLLSLVLLVNISMDKLILFSLINFIISIVTFLLYRYFSVVKSSEITFSILWNSSGIKSMLRFSYWIFLSLITHIGKKQGLILLLNIEFGVLVNAAYAIGNQISHAIENFGISFRQSLIPQIMTANSNKDLARLEKLIYTGTNATLLLLMLVSTPIFFETDFILRIWLVKVPLNANIFVKYAIIILFLESIPYFLIQAIYSSAKTWVFQLGISILNVLTFICLLLILQISNDYIIVLKTLVVFAIFSIVFIFIYFSKLFKYNITILVKKMIIPILIYTPILYSIIYIVQLFFDDGIFRFFFSSFISSVFLISILVFFVFNNYERKMIMNLIKTKLIHNPHNN